jgi:hypothetical protein
VEVHKFDHSHNIVTVAKLRTVRLVGHVARIFKRQIQHFGQNAKVLGSHSCNYEQCYSLCCIAVLFSRIPPMFRRNQSPPASGSKSKISKKSEIIGGSLVPNYTALQPRFSCSSRREEAIRRRTRGNLIMTSILVNQDEKMCSGFNWIEIGPRLVHKA